MGLPIAFAGAAVSKAKRLLKTPAHKRAAREAPGVVQRALAGDQAAIALLRHNAVSAATEKAKAIWRQALAQYEAGKKFEGPPPSAFDAVLDPIRVGAAEAIQTAAAGVGTLGARAVAPAGSAAAGAVNIPTDVTTLRNIALGAAGVVLLVVVVISLRR